MLQDQSAKASSPERGNRILDELSDADWNRLQRHLERVEVRAGEILYEADAPIGHVYFPIDTLISISAYSGSKQIEIALVGPEGVAGLPIALGSNRPFGLAVVQASGSLWRAEAEVIAALLDRHRNLHSALLGAVHGFVSEMAQNALAIGRSTIEQRLARRLSMMSTRLGSPSLAVTHDGLAKLLSVRRPGVTTALQALEAKQLVRSRRSQVEVLDAEGLRELARGGVGQRP